MEEGTTTTAVWPSSEETREPVAVQVVQEELQPVTEFPVFDPALVQLVPKILQVSLFPHPGPAGRFPVRYHAAPFPLVHHHRGRGAYVFGWVRFGFIVRGGARSRDRFGGEEGVGIVVVIPRREAGGEGGEGREGVGRSEGGEHGG